jgi:hypothetical protein
MKSLLQNYPRQAVPVLTWAMGSTFDPNGSTSGLTLSLREPTPQLSLGMRLWVLDLLISSAHALSTIPHNPLPDSDGNRLLIPPLILFLTSCYQSVALNTNYSIKKPNIIIITSSSFSYFTEALLELLSQSSQLGGKTRVKRMNKLAHLRMSSQQTFRNRFGDVANLYFYPVLQVDLH